MGGVEGHASGRSNYPEVSPGSDNVKAVLAAGIESGPMHPFSGEILPLHVLGCPDKLSYVKGSTPS